jgi:hypothetical protein
VDLAIKKTGLDHGFEINIQVFGGEKNFNTYKNARNVPVCPTPALNASTIAWGQFPN